jgi:hypothetical protein
MRPPTRLTIWNQLKQRQEAFVQTAHATPKFKLIDSFGVAAPDRCVTMTAPPDHHRRLHCSLGAARIASTIA